MNAHRILVLLLGLALAALPAAAQSSTDGWYLDPPETALDLAGGGNGGDAGGPWPGGGVAVRIAPKNDREKAMAAAALPLERGVLLAWPAWDGHDTEIVAAVLGEDGAGRSVRVTRNGERDEEPVLLREGTAVQMTWVHRDGGRASLRAVRLAADGSVVGRRRVVGPAGRARLVTLLPGGRVAALVLRGPAGHPRLELVVEGGERSPIARLGRAGTLLGVSPGEGGTRVFRFRDGALAGRLVVDGEGRVRDLAWGEN